MPLIAGRPPPCRAARGGLPGHRLVALERVRLHLRHPILQEEVQDGQALPIRGRQTMPEETGAKTKMYSGDKNEKTPQW